jgi:hypothetical protein
MATSVPYRIVRRTRNKTNGKPLSAYAIDITIRVNHKETYFLEDHNSDLNAMPHTDRAGLIKTIERELNRIHIEHFGHS